MEASIYLAVPHYGSIVPDALPSLAMPSARHRVTLRAQGASLLAYNFNRLWCDALNQRRERGLTHFAMHHADLAAPAGWLDTLIDEMQWSGADVLSVVVPIKDARGLTSTAVQHVESGALRRLTMHEIAELPETFDGAAVCKPGEVLLVNTGLWVCDFTRPWVEEAWFTIADRIVRRPDGTFQANVFSEDWNFSAWCQRRGLRVFATRIVPVKHFGAAGFGNEAAWGEWSTDREAV
jgi:hypothetical protein